MKKILLVFILLFPLNVLALAYPELNYEKAILYDITDNQILYKLKSDEKSSIASLTKIMTTITAIENCKNINDYVTYTNEMKNQVSWEASIAGLKVGDKVTYKDLLYASILPSGADATTALAISISGNIDNFVSKMNEIASKIGMTNTHFVNVTGLDEEGHYSTCEDLLILLKYALQNPLFKEIYTTKSYTLSNGLFVKTTLYALNKDIDRITGSKTGFTLKAGRCISTYFNSNNHEFILITLGAPPNNKTIHIKDALSLINFIDNNYHHQLIIKKNQLIKTIPIQYSKQESYEIKSSSKITKYLPDDFDKNKIKIEYKGLEELSFKNKENTKIGEVKYYYDNNLLKKEDIYLKTEIKIDIIKLLIAYKYIILIIIILILSIIISISRKQKKLNSIKK